MRKPFVSMIVFAGITMMMAGCMGNKVSREQNVNDDSNNVELDSLSPYAYDENQKGVTFSDDGTKLLRFPHNSKIKEYVVPEHVTGIEERAFMGCQSLKKVTIPATVREVGMAAFENCHSLEVVRIEAQLDTLPFRCFNGCESLKEVHLAQAFPPVIDEAEEDERTSLLFSFAEENLKACKVYVPKSAVSAYRKAYGWRLFKNIEPMASHHIKGEGGTL